MRSIILALFAPAILAGQETLQPGDRIRTLGMAGTYEWRQPGVVVSASRDSAVVRLAGRPEGMTTLAFSNLEVVRGQRTQAGRGALVGLGVGALTGFLLGFAGGEDCTGQEFICFDRPSMGMIGATLGMPTGAVIGAVVGRFNKTDRWVRLAPGR